MGLKRIWKKKKQWKNNNDENISRRAKSIGASVRKLKNIKILLNGNHKNNNIVIYNRLLI